MNNIRFQWDQNKNNNNIKKHKVSFEEAQLYFMMKMLDLFLILNIPIMKNDLLF